MAQYDFGLSFKEFSNLTPNMFRALGKRRVLGQRHERSFHGITAAAVYNTARTKDDQTMLDTYGFDFAMTDEQAAAKQRKATFYAFAKKVIGTMPMSTPIEKLQEVRLKGIKDLEQAGCEYAEEIFNTLWPTLKPKE